MRSRLDGLLGVVPGPTGVRHEERHEDSGDEGSGEQASQGFHAQDRPDQEWRQDGHDTGKDHLSKRRPRRDVDAACRVGLARALHDARDLPELTTDLLDHPAGGSAHGRHGQGRDHER